MKELFFFNCDDVKKILKKTKVNGILDKALWVKYN